MGKGASCEREEGVFQRQYSSSICRKGNLIIVTVLLEVYLDIGEVEVYFFEQVSCEQARLLKVVQTNKQANMLPVTILQYGALGFHRLQIWPILALTFRDLHFNRTGFRVLNVSWVAGLAIFL